MALVVSEGVSIVAKEVLAAAKPTKNVSSLTCCGVVLKNLVKLVPGLRGLSLYDVFLFSTLGEHGCCLPILPLNERIREPILENAAKIRRDGLLSQLGEFRCCIFANRHLDISGAQVFL